MLSCQLHPLDTTNVSAVSVERLDEKAAHLLMRSRFWAKGTFSTESLLDLIQGYAALCKNLEA
jgi:hypothetical protein